MANVHAQSVQTPPPCRTKWTRRVPHPVLIGHAASLSQVQLRGAGLGAYDSSAAGRAGPTACEAPLPPPRTKWTRRVPQPVLIGHAASLLLY